MATESTPNSHVYEFCFGKGELFYGGKFPIFAMEMAKYLLSKTDRASISLNLAVAQGFESIVLAAIAILQEC